MTRPCLVLRFTTLVIGLASVVAAAPPDDPSPLIEQVDGGVCHIEIAHDPQSDQPTTGSGFLISSDGLIITNWHVVAGGISGWLQFQGDGRNHRFPFDVLAFDKDSDLAILQAKAVSQLQSLRLWSFTLRLKDMPNGQQAYALGYPVEGFAAHRGSVINTRTYGEIDPKGKRFPADSMWVEHDCPIEASVTGGPLIDPDGHVAGVVTWSAADGHTHFAAPDSRIHAILETAQNSPGIAWSEIAVPSAAMLSSAITWDVPELRIANAPGSSVLSAVRALQNVAQCPICKGDGNVIKQSTAPSDNQLTPGVIRRSQVACKRCDGDGYTDDQRKVSRVLDGLTKKIAGLNPTDRRFDQASDQFFEKIGPVAFRSPAAWRTIVNAACTDRLQRLKTRTPIFGVGLIGEVITLKGVGSVSIVRPLVDAAITDPYVFVMVDPRLDNRDDDKLSAAFWGGVVADLSVLEDETTVVFIRNGFVMTPAPR